MPWRLTNDHEDDNIDADTLQRVLEDLNLHGCLEGFGGLGSSMEKLELSEGEWAQFSISQLILHHIQYKNTIVLMDDPMAKLDSMMRHRLADLVHEYFGASTVLITCEDANLFYDLDAIHRLRDGCIYESLERVPDGEDEMLYPSGSEQGSDI